MSTMPVPGPSGDAAIDVVPHDAVAFVQGSKHRFSDDISERIRRFIVDEGLEEGARLPSERDLAERFGTSRPTVSQALRRLSLLGMVDIRRGSGVYVLRRPATMVTASLNLMLDLDRDSISDLMQLRLWLETVAVEQAVVQPDVPSAAQARQLEEALDRLVQASAVTSRWMAADTVFHAAVVNLADNTFLTALYESVHTATLTWGYDEWVERNRDPSWLQGTDPEQHRALHAPIAEAVLANDVAAAREAIAAHHAVMVEHLEGAVSESHRSA
jgi:GntR family transcriptional regulator, transcriptional repressor for pyruvate dehydrogenase complex